MVAVWLRTWRGRYLRADLIAEVWTDHGELGRQTLLVRQQDDDVETEIVVAETPPAAAADAEVHLPFPIGPAADHAGEALLVRAATATPAPRTPPLPADFAERLVHIIGQCGTHHPGTVVHPQADADTWYWRIDTTPVSH